MAAAATATAVARVVVVGWAWPRLYVWRGRQLRSLGLRELSIVCSASGLRVVWAAEVKTVQRKRGRGRIQLRRRRWWQGARAAVVRVVLVVNDWAAVAGVAVMVDCVAMPTVAFPRRRWRGWRCCLARRRW